MTKLTYTNIRSLNKFKIPFIKSLINESSILILTETWGNDIILPNKKIITEKRENERGGGVLIAIPQEWKIIERLKLTNDGDDLIVRVSGERDKTIWIIAIYIKPEPKTTYANKLSLIKSFTLKILEKEKSPNIVIAGDFNRDILKSNPADSLSPYGLNIIEIPGPTFKRGAVQSKIDFIFISKNLVYSNPKKTFNSASDHAVLEIDLRLTTGNGRNFVVLPNKKLGNLILEKCILERPEDLISKFYNLLKKNQHNRALVVQRKSKAISFQSQIQEIFRENREMKEIQQDLSTMWAAAWENFEKQRFSPEQKIAFQTLRKLTKYDHFERAGGGIANCILNEDGDIISDTNLVNQQLKSHFSEIHSAPISQKLTKPNYWTGLKPISITETLDLMELMPKNKAISFDLISERLFLIQRDKNNKITEETLYRAEILSNIWNSSFLNSNIIEIFLESRLIPLNKKFPSIPKIQEIRPIVVSSWLIKFMELRFRSKLRNYMIHQLHESQIGFVPEMGIEVNLLRLFEICQERKNSKPVLLFIDFSNAYNTIYHQRLFDILRNKKILENEEIDFLIGLYANTKIRIGKSEFLPERGVMQGSPISPYLFNIYSEPLLENLTNRGDLTKHEILAYADDICIVCHSIPHLKRTISIIEEWSRDNGLTLNKKKSGILQIVNSRQKVTISMKEIMGIPIVPSYKYLGINLNNKIQIEHHMSKIKPKINYLTYRLKLIPHKQASHYLRANLWNVFIRPLITMSLIFATHATSTSKNNIEKWARSTFKKICGLSPTVNNLIVEKLIGSLQLEKAEEIIIRAGKKWKNRIIKNNVVLYSKNHKSHENINKQICNDFISCLNIINKKICSACDRDQRLTPLHLTQYHGISIGIWNPIKDLSQLEDKILDSTSFKTKYSIIYNKIKDF